MGGSLTYSYSGFDAINNTSQYHVTLKIYRYCDQTSGGTADLDAFMMLGVYKQDITNPGADKDWFETDNLDLTSQQFITPPSANSICAFNTTVCVEEGIYEADISLPVTTGGYHLLVERCCRNGNIVNLSNPGSIGQTYYCFIPPDPVINSSPVFNDIPVPFICSGDSVTIVNNATDPDGDLLVYSFATPYIGNSSSGIAIPDPQLDNDPYAMPIATSLYNPGYSVTQPFGSGGYASIDTATGQTKYYIPNQGFYVVVIEIKEYRNGILIATIRRDLQLIAIPCPPNNSPVLSHSNGSGVTNIVITEGQTFCFPLIFTDPEGDSLYLTSSGNVFNSAFVNPPATLANASGLGIVVRSFCWSTECGQARNTPYQFTVNVLDNGCPPKQTSQVFSITVLPSPIPPAPAISIAANPAGPICTGTAVTFTAVPTFGGSSPQFQWHLNGVNVGTNSNTFSSSTLINGDIITCTLTSNSTCVSIFTANSNPIVMVVNPFIAPAVAISANPAGIICSGTNVTFTAVPVNPGATPIYQWQVNGVNVGINSNTYASTALKTGDVVSVSLLSNSNCPAAASNSITLSVTPTLTPSVTITANVSGNICPLAPVTFTATQVNGGSAPSYQWQINGVNVGSNSAVFTNASWNNGDVVQVILTSNFSCVTSPTANSNTINMSVTAPSVPSVSISQSPASPVCAGDNVIFTAVPVLGGATPSYQWKKNVVNVGSNSNVFASSTLSNGDNISVVMTSNSPCATTATANSNIIIVTVQPVVAAGVSIVSDPFPVCFGTAVNFTATPVNGGTTPFYQWQVNGVSMGTNSSTFVSGTLANGNSVRVQITSNERCVSPSSAFSNTIVAVISPLVTPSVIISAVPATPVCPGDNVVFTAVSTNGGVSPNYQWKVNGVNVGTNTAVFSTTALSNNDAVEVEMTSNISCPSPASVNSNRIVVSVNPALTPTVTIAANPSTPICDGTPVVFHSVSINGGASPNYQWLINGMPAGTNADSLTSSALQDLDSVTVVLTSNALCAQPAKDTSNIIGMTVFPNVTPAITITQNPAGPVCVGSNVVFTAVPLAGGTAPVYQWSVNGISTGTNQDTFTSNTLQTGDTVQVQLISNANCLLAPSASSNLLIMVVKPLLTPAVSITSTNDTICPAENVTFIALPINPGSSPVYEWTVNAISAGTNSDTFITTTLNNGDNIKVGMTTSELCYTTQIAFSNVKTITVNPNLTPEVSILPGTFDTICFGTPMTYTASINNGGDSPHFQWMINGVNTGPDSSVFESSTINNLDAISVILTSNATCVLPPSDTSNTVITLVEAILTPSISITANPPGIFCDGTMITYTASSMNEGFFPVYQWSVNHSTLPVSGDSFTTNQLQDGDTLDCILTSSILCPTVNPVVSNKLIIDRLPTLVADISGTEEICFGKDANLSISATGGNGGPYYYAWDNNLGSDTTYTLSPAVSTTYTVTVTDSCSTVQQAFFTIKVDPLPIPEFAVKPESATILNPFFDFINQSFNANRWLWNFGDTTFSNEQFPQHTYLNPGTYKVQLIATSAEGCIDSIYNTLYVEEVTTIYFPNSFTPNGDDINDFFAPVGHSIPPYEMTIYNRWGEKIFYTDTNLSPWRGEVQNSGAAAKDGVYVYRARFKGQLKKKDFEGSVTLIR